MSLRRVLYTRRLRLEPVTDAVIDAASKGRAALEACIDAAMDEGWRGGYVFKGPRGTRLAFEPRHVLVIHERARTVIGEVRFDRLAGGDGFEIGYAIAPAWRRQGFAVEATETVIRALAETGAAAVIAGCAMKNVASVRTLRRLGFELDGATRADKAFWWIRTLQG